jgi:hypothetical protein
MYGYEIPVSESAYNAKERYLSDKKTEKSLLESRKEYSEFIANSRDYFLVESINMILQNSLNEDTSKEDREYAKALVEGFVREKGSIKLLSEMATKSLMLAGIADLVKESHTKVIHSCKEGDSKTLKITKTIEDNFFDKLIGLNDDKITEKINERVCASLEDFVQANVNDKLDLEELAEKTQEKIANIKNARSTEEAARIKESFVQQYNREAARIKQRANRKVSVYEQIMDKMTRSIVADEAIRESFVLESGQLDMGKITGKVTTMYTFLEMLNTTKIVNVNEAYIENILKNM